MRIILSLIILLNTQQLFSQINYSFQISSTHAISYKKPSSLRKSGIDIGYRFNVPINKNFNFESGINIGFWGRSNYYRFSEIRWMFDSYYDSISNTYIYGDKKNYYYRSDFRAIDIELPLLAEYRTTKLEYKFGVLIYGRSLFEYVWWKDYGSESEIDSYFNGVKPVTPNSGIAFNTAISCKILHNFKLFVDYKKIVYKFYKQENINEYYSLIGLGCSYTLTNK
ncbi:MAG: hypothetical protein BWY22_01469 [Bacteroidetes bacterium ADurb.Bin217]|nr:MAG: hypothetical protein BWY22_01469 [Bacteroidetes bacterium ADurb.Bin217]